MANVSPGSNAALKGNGGITVDETASRSPYVNLRKQAKYVLIGSVGAWYWQVYLHIADALQGARWSQ